MIEVVFPNGSQRPVRNEDLDGLIERREIISFHRTDGWVVLGRDTMRSNSRPTLCIPERRQQALRDFDLYLKSLKS